MPTSPSPRRGAEPRPPARPARSIWPLVLLIFVLAVLVVAVSALPASIVTHLLPGGRACGGFLRHPVARLGGQNHGQCARCGGPRMAPAPRLPVALAHRGGPALGQGRVRAGRSRRPRGRGPHGRRCPRRRAHRGSARFWIGAGAGAAPRECKSRSCRESLRLRVQIYSPRWATSAYRTWHRRRWRRARIWAATRCISMIPPSLPMPMRGGARRLGRSARARRHDSLLRQGAQRDSVGHRQGARRCARGTAR